MDWKWWIPFLVSVLNLFFVFRQTQIMKAQSANPTSGILVRWPWFKSYWPLLAMAFLVIATWIPYAFEVAFTQDEYLTMNAFDKKPVKTVNCHGRKKANETIALDGMAYRNCIFENVTFVYNGTAPFSLSDNNSFIGSRHLKSDSGMVNYTLALLRDLGWISGQLNVQEEIPLSE